MKLHELNESVGADAVMIGDWLSDQPSPPDVKAATRQMLSQLLKRGYKLYTNTGWRLNENSTFGFSFIFPADSDHPYKMKAIFHVLYTDFKEDDAGIAGFYKYDAFYSAPEIMEIGLGRFMDRMRASARKIK